MADSGLSAIDWTVIRTSTIAGLMVVVPATLLSGLLVGDGERPALAFLFIAVTLIGFTVAGFGAGRLRDDTPIAHGAVAAVTCYAIVQIVGTIRRLAAGDDINIASYPVAAILAAFCGVSGALFAERLQRQRHTS